MNNPCPQTLTCPPGLAGPNDNPVMNLSSEAPDDLTYTAIAFPSWNPLDPLSPSDPAFTAPGCISECTSAVSQADADLCAANEAFLCANPTNPVFYNEAASCSVSCPDGQTFTAIVAAGKYVAGSQGAANELAHNAACAQANAEKTCPSSPPSPPVTPGMCVIVTSSPLPDATVGTPYTFGIAFAGTITEPLTWLIISGALPDGLTLDSGSGTISGTPTVVAAFSFTVQLENPTNYCQQAFVLTVDEPCITDNSALPGDTVGTPYDYTPDPSVIPDPGYVLLWSIGTGALPDGLSLNTSTGEITGTPTNPGTFTFQVCLGQQQGGGGPS